MDAARTAGRLGAAAVLASLVLLLVGCSVAPLLPVSERSGTAADPAALALAWSTPATEPVWIPADATSIRWVASTLGGADAAAAAVRLRSAAPLPEDCVEDAEPGTATITAAWAPESPVRSALRCGNWAVVPVRGGYFAWTPASLHGSGPTS